MPAPKPALSGSFAEIDLYSSKVHVTLEDASKELGLTNRLGHIMAENERVIARIDCRSALCPFGRPV